MSVCVNVAHNEVNCDTADVAEPCTACVTRTRRTTRAHALSAIDAFWATHDLAWDEHDMVVFR